MIITQGGSRGGWALMFEKGKPVFHYNFADVAHYEVAAKDALSPGKHTIKMDFSLRRRRHRQGRHRHAHRGRQGGRQGADRARPMPIRFSLDETFDVGEDTGTPVNLNYDVPFKFTGKIEKVVVQLGDTKLTAADAERVRGLDQAARRSIE